MNAYSLKLLVFLDIRIFEAILMYFSRHWRLMISFSHDDVHQQLWTVVWILRFCILFTDFSHTDAIHDDHDTQLNWNKWKYPLFSEENPSSKLRHRLPSVMQQVQASYRSWEPVNWARKDKHEKYDSTRRMISDRTIKRRKARWSISTDTYCN